MNPGMMMNPMGMVGSHAPPGATQSAPQGQDVNPYHLWLDAWRQMQNQQAAAAQ
jgi:hypothetical protein